MAWSLNGPSILKLGAQGQSWGGSSIGLPIMVSQIWYTGNTAAGGHALIRSGTANIVWDVYNAAAKDYNDVVFSPPRRFTNLILATLSNGGAVYVEKA